MPELPEVETTLRGIEPYLLNRSVVNVKVRKSRLRWPIPATLPKMLARQTIQSLSRRGKYLIISFQHGHMLIHLGMSGSLRIVSIDTAARKHDHIDWQIDNNKVLRLHDPRRFGSVLWTATDPLQHPLLVKLGPEPLTRELNGAYLFKQSRKRKVAVKNFVMDAQIVVGVGNIYASEALFIAGIHPARAAGKVSLQRYKLLADAIKKILKAAIKQGGTTLRDFVNEQGNPGYFSQKLKVYERAGEPCSVCGGKIKKLTLGQRSSYYCGHCQH
ncbi:MAG: bifunctional DNA-formamidopyrimidine glycosylase/DNA-(apurinic or apyrimidinic site) lyase [Gammaproteobacteria bacterium]|nr:bifunctional DNA-formamidopyrimidine glycosylase/DNA-(apurinic or apyrimidinic site) lyase [Gammaproteobacteria bacterium]